MSAIAQYDVSGLDLDKEVNVWFDQQIGIQNTQLIAGVYQPTQISTNSHPFFLEKVWINGDINYRGQEFKNVNLIYNIYEDHLLLKHPYDFSLSGQPIRLETGLVDHFVLKEYHFKNLKNISNAKGFYNILYDGKTISLVSKRSKKEVIKSNSEPVGYEEDDKYYLIINNELKSIRNKAGFIKYFADLKKDINTFVKQSQIQVNIKNEIALQTLTQFCDEKITTK